MSSWLLCELPMRRFIKRKLALFDWIHNLSPNDQVIAYRAYTLMDYIRLSRYVPFVTAIPILAVPCVLFASSKHYAYRTEQLFLYVYGLYLIGTFLFWFLYLRPKRLLWIQELQALFQAQETSHILCSLTQMDPEMEEETHSFLRPSYERPPRRARYRKA